MMPMKSWGSLRGVRHVRSYILVLPSSNHGDSSNYLGDLSFSFYICKILRRILSVFQSTDFQTVVL